VDEKQRSAILQEVVDLSMPPIKRAGDFTIGEYMAAMNESGQINIGRQFARDRLEELVREGVLETQKVFDPQRSRQWRKVEREEIE